MDDKIKKIIADIKKAEREIYGSRYEREQEEKRIQRISWEMDEIKERRPSKAEWDKKNK